MPDRIEIRTLLRLYAWLVVPLGFVLFGWGSLWFGVPSCEDSNMSAAQVRIFGSFVMSAGLCAAGFAAIEDLCSLRRAFLWFTGAHAAVLFALVTQVLGPWGDGVGQRAAETVFAICVLFLYAWRSSRQAPGQSTTALRREYNRRIRQAAAQEERSRLARDLHDSIKQQLFVVQTSTAAAQERLDVDPAGAQDALTQVREAARAGLSEMEAMLEQLRAAPVENAGLLSLIGQQCEALGFRTGAHVEWRPAALPPNRQMPPGAQDALLRVAQEALANVGRHARARNVSVFLGIVRGAVELRITDDGAGFDTNSTDSGMGIGNMRSRAAELGGTLELISGTGAGTTVVFSVPLTVGTTAAEYRTRSLSAALLLVAVLFALVYTGQMMMAVLGVLAVWQITENALRYRRMRREETAA